MTLTERQRDIRDILALRLIDEGYAIEDLTAILVADPGEIATLIEEVLMHEADEQGLSA